MAFAGFAQEGTSSPYSFYGIGDIKFKGTAESRSMGSISVLSDSIHFNFQNPANLAALKLTSFAIGGTYATTRSETESQDAKARRTSLDYLAVGVPVGKLGIGFGLVPYSSLGYKIGKTTYTIQNNDTLRSVYSRYTGIGGVNKVFFGLGYKITKHINFGADIQYNFGTIETKNLQFQSDLQYGSRENNSSEVRGINFDLGLTYQTKTSSRHTFFSSISYTPQAELTLANSRSIELVQFNTVTITPVQTDNIPVEDTTIKLPSKLTFGSGFGQVKKWLVGGEISFIKNSVMSNRFDDIDPDGHTSWENSVRYSLGGFYIPNYNSYSNYLKRVVYRAGLRYENTGLVFYDKSINDFAANIGLGLPLGGTFSNINIGLEIGKRGTKYYNLVEENYINLSVGLSLSDKWFVKRKYD